MKPLIIKLSTIEADFIFPADEEGMSLKYHEEKQVQEILQEVKANSGPFPEDWTCTDWEYFEAWDEQIYIDEHGDELLNVAKCKFGEETILWVCVF